jgi:hypothetical protein
MARSPLALVLAAAALLPVACGGDEPTVAEYREQGNRVCRDVARESRAGPQDLEAPAAVEANIKSAEDFQRRLDALEAPEELRERHDRVVALGQENLDLLKRARKSLDESRVDEYRLLVEEELPALAEKGNDAFLELGLDDCAPE